MKNVFAMRVLLPVTMLCFLVIAPVQAQSVRVTTSVGDYEVSTISGMFDDASVVSTLMSQVWWGNEALAHEFAALVSDSVGVQSGFFEIGPLFAYTTDVPPSGFDWDVGGAAWCGAGTQAFCNGTETFYNPGNVTGFYAVAVPASIDVLLTDLSATIFGINLQAGISNSLDAKLNSVLLALDDTNANNDIAALNSMYAFCSSVEAQRAKKLTNEQANELIAAANSVIHVLDEFAPLCY